MTCQWMSMSRTLAASSTQRLVSQAQGHSGSNQTSTRARVGLVSTASVMGVLALVVLLRSGAPAGHRSVLTVPSRGVTGFIPPRRRVARAPAGGIPGDPAPASWHAPAVAVPNLTRVDAAARADLLTVHRYDLRLDVTDGAGNPGEGTFLSETTVEFESRRPGENTFIDEVEERVR